MIPTEVGYDVASVRLRVCKAGNHIDFYSVGIEASLRATPPHGHGSMIG